MSSKKRLKKKTEGSSSIAVNRRAHHDYALLERFDAGLSLEGWEVKSLRDGRGQLSDSYVVVKHGEAFLVGAHIPPLTSASTHIQPVADRSRKLLLQRKELNSLIGAVERKGFTVVPLKLFWKRNLVKCEIALAKGKKLFDKRETEKKRDWQREQARNLKSRG